MINGKMAFGEGAEPDFVNWMRKKNETPDASELTNENFRYIDLAQEFVNMKPQSYSDFEAMLSEDDVKFIEMELAYHKVRATKPFILDLLAHYLVANIGEAGYTPERNECTVFVDTMEWLFTSRFMMKKDADA